MARTKNWDDELLKAAENGNLIKVQTALENGANPNAKNNDGWTPLHIAAYKGHVEIVKILLDLVLTQTLKIIITVVRHYMK